IVCFAPQTKKPYRNPIGLCRFGAESRDRLRRSRLRGERNHAHGLLGRLALHGVLDLARDAGVEGMVAPHADVDAGVHHRPALAKEELPGIDLLAAKDLDAEPLRLRVAAVARAAACLLVCHELALNDFVDADLGVVLPMALGFLIVLAPAELEDLHLLAAPVREHGRIYLGAGDEGGADLHVLAAAHEEHLAERNARAD